MQDIYLYTEFNRSTAEMFSKELDKTKGEAVNVRLYSYGGVPTAGYVILAKMSEHGAVSLKVDGDADSMAAFSLCYAKGVECLEISSFTFHRAAARFPSDNETMLTELERINAFLRKGLESKVDPEAFKRVTGVSIDELFSMDGRIDVTINAEQAKELGLVDKVKAITPDMIGAINSRLEIAASTSYTKLNTVAETKPTPKTVNTNTNIMTIEKLRSEHPEVFQEAVALGANQEKDRAGAWLAFVDVDAEAVAEGIKNGESISQTAMATFSRKALSAENLKKLGEDSEKEIKTEEQKIEATTEQKKEQELEAMTSEVLANLGISKN